MPNSPKSPLLLIACAVAGLFLLLVALRHEAAKPVQDKAHLADMESEEDDFDAEFGRTRVGRVARLEPPPPPPATRRPPSEFLAQKIEDYEAEKKRSFGDSWVVGRVRDQKNRGIGGAQVSLYENDPNTTNPPLREATADQDGSFTLTQLHDGDRVFVMVARAQGFAPEAQRIRLQGAPGELDITLVPPVTLGGKVINAVTSEPLVGVQVVHPSDTDEVFGVLGSVTTGAGGSFTFEDCHPGRVVTRATMRGYRSITARLRAPSTTETIVMMPGGSTVRGVTVDRLTSRPQSGARVWLETDRASGSSHFRNSRMTAEDGKFEFTDLPGGNYRIYAARGMRSERQEFSIGDDEIKEGVALTLPSDLFVSGKVVDANEGKTLPGVRIWYRAPSGTNSVLSDKDGLFAFDTMAVDSYTIQVHEKGYLPVQDKKSTAVVETITRRVPSNASSDTFILKLRPVPSISGVVTARRREDGPKLPVWNAEVSVSYLIGENHEKLNTKTGPKGDFFVNLPQRRRGDATVIAFKNNAVAATTLKVPNRKSVELNLKRTSMYGNMILSDFSPLSGVRIGISHFLPENRENGLVIRERDFYTNNGGRFFVPLPERKKLQFTFHLPASVQISKIYQSDNLLNRRTTFIYDPITNDVLLDSGRDRNSRDGNQGQQRQGQNNREGQQQGGNRRPDGQRDPNRTPRPQSN